MKHINEENIILIFTTLFWLCLTLFSLVEFLGASVGIGGLSEIATITPKLYWLFIFPIGLGGVGLFGTFTYFGIDELHSNIYYRD